jgi:hypothetical protein
VSIVKKKNGIIKYLVSFPLMSCYRPFRLCTMFMPVDNIICPICFPLNYYFVQSYAKIACRSYTGIDTPNRFAFPWIDYFDIFIDECNLVGQKSISSSLENESSGCCKFLLEMVILDSPPLFPSSCLSNFNYLFYTMIWFLSVCFPPILSVS